MNDLNKASAPRDDESRPLSPVFEHSEQSDTSQVSQFAESELVSVFGDPSKAPPPEDLTGRMGQAFVTAGKLTQEEVARIVQIQRRRRIRFGEAAIRLGLLSEEDVHEVLAQQFNYQSVVRRPGKNPRKDVSTSIQIAHTPYSTESETIRRFRSEILLRAGEHPCLVLALTSPNPGEGKSHLAASLAVAFSQLNLKTLLIDANLRRPSQHQIFKLTNKTGLSTMLVGRTLATLDLSHVISPFLNVLTAGPKPPNPSEILSFPSLTELIDVFRADVKVVIIDTPSTSVGPDAQIIAPQAEHVVMVCRKNHTSVESLHKAFSQLETTSADILGSFLNDVPPGVSAHGGSILDGDGTLSRWQKWARIFHRNKQSD